MPRKGILWSALILSVLVVCMLVGPAYAAIGIYKYAVTTDSQQNAATFNYYLNVDASAGTIQIKDAGGATIKTIDLAAVGKLSKGTMHSVIWQGDDTTTGGNAATGTYTAVINVTADAVTATTALWSVDATSAFGGTNGIAVDTNPGTATYGNIYASRKSDHNIQVYNPDGSAARIITTGFTGGSSPWGGVQVGAQGRIYSTDRSAAKAGSFDPLTGAGTFSTTSISNTQGMQCAVMTALDGGIRKDKGFVFASGSTTAASQFRYVPVNGDTYALGSGVVFASSTDSATNAAGSNTDWHPTDAAKMNVYLVWSNGASAGGTEKWSFDGTTWTKDGTFAMQGALGRQSGIAPYPDGTKLAGLFNQGTNAIRMLDPTTGAATGEQYSLPTPFTTSCSGGNYDNKGNLAVVCGQAISVQQPRLGVIAFPDQGSTDTVTLTVPHVRASFAPYLVNGSFSATEIPADNATTMTFTGTVVDLDGNMPSHLATAKISCFGVDYTLSKTSIDSTSCSVTATGIKCPLRTKTGLTVCPVTLIDGSNPAANNSQISDPLQYATVTVTGGRLAGTVMLDLSSTERAPITAAVTLHAKDKNAPAKTYDFTTAADGTYDVSVHAGTFTVTADTNTGSASTSGYAQGKVIDNVVVTLNNTTSGIEPGVAPLTIYQAKALDNMVPMALKGICDAARYDALNGFYGFTDSYFLRDQSLPGGKYDGIKVSDAGDVSWPLEKQTIIIEGKMNLPMGDVRIATNVTSFHFLNTPAETDYGQPDPCVITDINAMTSSDATWGRLYKLSGVTVKSIDTAANRITVTDGTNDGVIDIFASTGIATGEALTTTYPVGKRIDVVGVKDHQGLWLANCLRPRKPEDITDSVVTKTYATSNQYVKFGKWNLVSIPADPDPTATNNGDPLQIFSGIDVAQASLQYWKNDVDGGGYVGYGANDNWYGPIVRGTPYWFMEPGTPSATSDKDISYIGVPPAINNETEFIKSVPTHTAAPFWVMFGTPYGPAQGETGNALKAENVQFRNTAKRGANWLSWAEAFSETDASLRIVDSNAQGWDAANNKFISVTPPPWMGESDQFEPWWGYWMLVYDNNALDIRFPNPGP